MPIILLSCCSDSSDKTQLYQEAVRRAGGTPLVITRREDIPETYDALLLPGGGDAAPRFGGYRNPTGLLGVDPARDALEEELYLDALERGVRVLGVCRGMQMINCFQGGSLHADLARDAGVAEPHAGGTSHGVHKAPGSLVSRLWPGSVVNSFHHQAVARLGTGLVITAWSPAGVAEAAEHRTLPVLGVQWHPERMSYAMDLWNWLVRDC